MDKNNEKCEEQNIFPKVCRVIENPNFVDIYIKYQYQHPVILKYLGNKINGWNIGDFFHEHGYQSIAIYAITEFTELMLLDITRNSKWKNENIFLYDTNYKRFSTSYMGYEVKGMDALISKYRIGELDCIVVCSLLHENEIISSLMKKGIMQEHIISIASVIFSE